MVREVLTVNVGQAGIQLGQSVWLQYQAEHGLDNTGNQTEKTEDDSFKVFYEESGSGQFVPRNISVDLEPNVVDDVRNSEIGSVSLLFKQRTF